MQDRTTFRGLKRLCLHLAHTADLMLRDSDHEYNLIAKSYARDVLEALSPWNGDWPPVQRFLRLRNQGAKILGTLRGENCVERFVVAALHELCYELCLRPTHRAAADQLHVVHHVLLQRAALTTWPQPRLEAFRRRRKEIVSECYKVFAA